MVEQCIALSYTTVNLSPSEGVNLKSQSSYHIYSIPSSVGSYVAMLHFTALLFDSVPYFQAKQCMYLLFFLQYLFYPMQ